MKFKHLFIVTIVVQIVAAFTGPTIGMAQGLLIDDFTTGEHFAIRWFGNELDVQGGSMLGGFRRTNFIIASNDRIQPGILHIRRGEGPLVIDAGFKVQHRLEITYGIDSIGSLAPLNLDLSSFDRLSVDFEASDLGVNFNIVIFSGNGTARAQLGFNLVPSITAFSIDFPLVDFSPVGDFDIGDVDLIVLVLQSGSATGGNDYAVTSISAENP